MAGRLVDRFGPEVPERIAVMVAAVDPRFDGEAFVADALAGHEPLGLMDRGRHFGAALRAHLPRDDAEAIALLARSLGPPRPADGPPEGMAPFLYLPHSFVIADHGLACFEVAMDAQRALTRVFTAEFCIRPFLERRPGQTLERLEGWAGDPDAHVRRLVSEGTRPRLPWAPRLGAFQRDPAPVLALLERLRDDPSAYVRRAVANNLNDIGKDHPGLLVATAARWARDAGPERTRLIRRALRSRIAAGDPAAMAVLGHDAAAPARARIMAIDPEAPRIGDVVRIAVEIVNPGPRAATYALRLRARFARPGGRTATRVFSLGERALGPGEAAAVTGRLSLAQHTTRTHHPGRHGVEVLVNGVVRAEGGFDLGV